MTAKAQKLPPNDFIVDDSSGTRIPSPRDTSMRCIRSSIQSPSWASRRAASSAASTSPRQPRCTAAPGSAASTTQASVLP